MKSITYGKDRYHQIHEMELWCRDILGDGGWHTINTIPEDMGWWMNVMFGNTTFAFKQEKHYTLFILRWGL